MEQKMRLFIAINFPRTVKEKIHLLQQHLYSTHRKIKWVEWQNFHLTLKFLGPTEKQMVPHIIKTLTGVASKFPPLTLNLKQLGTLPSKGRPRVVWLGVTGEVAVLTNLQHQVEHSLARLGFPVEKRRFMPHLTLGRIKSNDDHKHMWETILSLNNEGISIDNVEIKSIELVQSVLQWQGPVYKQLASFNLAGIN